MKNLRIGIPRALLYYRYSDAWKALFEDLGYEVITSPETTEGIFKNGLRKSQSDLCLPVKAFLGHVDSLKDSVDFLFMPRYVSVEHDAYMCPKLIGLPDVVRACFRNLPRTITPMFHIKQDRENAAHEFARQIAEALSLKHPDVADVFIKHFISGTEEGSGDLAAPHHLLQDPSPEEKVRATGIISEKKLNIGLVGRPYLLFDRYLGKNLFRFIRNLGANPVYIHPSEDEIKEAMTIIPKWVYWSMGKEVVASAHSFFKDDYIDGVINICSATCGPDAFTGDLIRKRLNARNKPYMSLSIDEHTSDVGIQTRLEAFTDMLSRIAV